MKRKKERKREREKEREYRVRKTDIIKRKKQLGKREGLI